MITTKNMNTKAQTSILFAAVFSLAFFGGLFGHPHLASGQTSVSADIKANSSDGGITVMYGDSVNLSWSSTGATSCKIDNPWIATIEGSAQGSLSMRIAPVAFPVIKTDTYWLTCKSASGSTARDSITITAKGSDTTSGTGSNTNNQNTGNTTYTDPNSTDVTITASPKRIEPRGNSVIAWSAPNMSSCTTSGGWSGQKPTSGSETVFPNESTEYVLTCVNGSRTIRKSVIVYVGTTPITGNSAQTSLVVRARNLTAQETQYGDTVKAQGLDNVEFEIRLTGSATAATQMRILAGLPKELFYLPASTKINGVQIPDGIAEASGIFIGDIATNETKVITFTAVVFYGVEPKTLSVAVTAKGSATFEDSVNLQIANRGQVLGASTVVTGPEHIVLWVIFAGFLAASVLYAVLYNRRVQTVGKNIQYSATINALRAVEKRRDA